MRYQFAGSRAVVVSLLAAAGLLVSGVVVAAPASASPGAASPSHQQQPPAETVPDVDDHSGDPLYATFYGQQVAWSVENCPESLPAEHGLECAKVRAPKDWADPSVGELQVGISRPAGATQKPRLLLTNPGGPGGSGLGFGSVVVEELGLQDTHLPIDMDPRGLATSTQLVCPQPTTSPGSYLADGDARSFDRASVLAAAQDQKRYNRDCAQANPDLLPYIDSVQTAYDVNLVRHLMGYETADFYGVSYGTWLGSLTARMFDSRFDRVILDSNTDFQSGSFDTLFTYWPRAFQASFDRTFLPYIARHHDRYGLGSTPEEVNASYELIRDSVTTDRYGPHAKRDVLDNLLRGTQYSATSFHDAAQLLAIMKADLAGDTSNRELIKAIFSMMDGVTDANSDSVFSAVVCNDTGGEQNAGTWYAKRKKTAVDMPLAGPTNLVNVCAGWQGSKDPAITGKLLKRPLNDVLMVQTEVDPATPYPGARSSYLGSTGSRQLVTVDDAGGHGAAGTGSQCLDDLATAYLRDGVRPRANAWCQAGPIVTGEEPIVENAVYEFGHPASDRRPLPRPYTYRSRDLTPPAPDTTAGIGTRPVKVLAAGPATSTSGTAADREFVNRLRGIVEDAQERTPAAGR